MKEEEYIRKKAGFRNPFRVPQGYFDSFASQIIDKLPERGTTECVSEDVTPSHHRHFWLLRPIVYAAACICIAVFSLAAYFLANQSSGDAEDGTFVASQYQNTPAGTYEDDIIDCAMMDNTDIYAYLSSEH